MPDDLIFLGESAAETPADDPAQALEALRVSAADALERGLAFVEEHGDERARGFARVVLRADPPSRWESAESAAQDGEGAFAPRPPEAFGLVGRALGPACANDRALATIATLVMLADIRALRAPCVERAVRFLEGTQRDDGSFGAEGVAEEDRLVATALAGGALGRTREVRPDGQDAAGNYLASRWQPERVEGAGPGALLAWSHFFSNVRHDASDEILQWCGRELEKGFRSGSREALVTTRILSICDVAALPGSAIAPGDLLQALLAEQAGDGGFDALAPEGPPGRVIPTVEAMRAAIGLCAGLDE